MKVPSYRKHSTRDLAFSEYQGRRRYFPGPFGSDQSKQAYTEFLRTEFNRPEPAAEASGLTVAGLVAQYLHFARGYYGDGSHGEFANLKYALKPFATHFYLVLAADFGPLLLKAWQKHLIAKGDARSYINQQGAKIRRAFSWAVSEELIPASVHQAISTVPPLRAGRTEAVETMPRQGVPWSDVEPVLAELSPLVADMVRVQWLTGVRSGSLCRAAAGQFLVEDPLWQWRPQHKTQRHMAEQGRELVLHVGPQCQRILSRYIAAAAAGGESYLFCPRTQRANRRYGARYTTRSYYRAVARAIERINRRRREANKPLLAPWTPHQMRHGRGQEIRERYGIEGAQAFLGHDSLEAVQIYTHSRRGLNARIAAEAG